MQLRGGVCTLTFTNNSAQPVYFEFVYPAQALDVTPGRGEIASYTSVSVVVRSHVRTRSLAPHMYVLLNGMEHKLQITGETTGDSRVAGNTAASQLTHARAPMGQSQSTSSRDTAHLPLRGSLPWNIAIASKATDAGAGADTVNGRGVVPVSDGHLYASASASASASAIASQRGLDFKTKQGEG